MISNQPLMLYVHTFMSTTFYQPLRAWKESLIRLIVCYQWNCNYQIILIDVRYRNLIYDCCVFFADFLCLHTFSRYILLIFFLTKKYSWVWFLYLIQSSKLDFNCSIWSYIILANECSHWPQSDASPKLVIVSKF